MGFSFSKRSLRELEGVHPDLLRVVERAGELCGDCALDFVVTDGCRTVEEQVEFVRRGASRTMHSRHLGGFAIDYVALVAGRVSYDPAHMAHIAELFKKASNQLGVPIVWGGDWSNFRDTPHIELAKTRYPDVIAV